MPICYLTSRSALVETSKTAKAIAHPIFLRRGKKRGDKASLTVVFVNLTKAFVGPERERERKRWTNDREGTATEWSNRYPPLYGALSR